MKLYLLKARTDLKGSGYRESNDDPWYFSYDTVNSLVVRAENEEIARKLADSISQDEASNVKNCPHPWIDSNYSICSELLSDGKEEIIIVDCNQG